MAIAIMNKLLLSLCTFLSLTAQAQKYESLALTPPMGWNSWNMFQTYVNEKLVIEMADAMVASGMKDAGYTYLIIDDGWLSMNRDNAGNLVADPQKFPRGIKVVSDYVHSKGLKFGLYTSAGTKTCAGFPGTRGYEYQDARLYASWGLDYLKYDWCYSEDINPKEAYGTMSKAIRTAGRPMVLSICEWGSNKPWQWGKAAGHLWRTTGDITNCFDCVKDNGGWYSYGVMRILDKQDSLYKYAGPGSWNDPDMLVVGNGMTVNEDRAHFSMWSISAAPLIAGNDLRRMSKETKAILTNSEVIAINQDSLGRQGYKYADKDSLQTWFKPLRGGGWAVCFLNRSVKPKRIQFNWKANRLSDTTVAPFSFDAVKSLFRIRNLWTKRTMGNTDRTFKAQVAGRDVIMLRLTRM